MKCSPALQGHFVAAVNFSKSEVRPRDAYNCAAKMRILQQATGP